MTGQFENIRVYLETEGKRLADELQSKLSQGTFEAHEGSPFGKREETATEYFALESQLAAVQHIRQQLAEVERALEKLAKGTYGLCDSCGKPIPVARLEAIPQANLCLDCKTRQTRPTILKQSPSPKEIEAEDIEKSVVPERRQGTSVRTSTERTLNGRVTR